MKLPDSIRQHLQDIIFERGAKPNQWASLRALCPKNSDGTRPYLFDLIRQDDDGRVAETQTVAQQSSLSPSKEEEFPFKQIIEMDGWFVESPSYLGGNLLAFHLPTGTLALLGKISGRPNGTDCGFNVNARKIATEKEYAKGGQVIKRKFAAGVQQDQKTLIGSIPLSLLNDELRNIPAENGRQGYYHWFPPSKFTNIVCDDLWNDELALADDDKLHVVKK